MNNSKKTYKSTHCKSTGKYCYSSQAKAIRARNRYKNIRREYHCDKCDSWHTTSMGVGLGIKVGIIEKPKKRKKISKNHLQKRLEYLKKKE